jgi:hypothetical protein
MDSNCVNSSKFSGSGNAISFGVIISKELSDFMVDGIILDIKVGENSTDNS